MTAYVPGFDYDIFISYAHDDGVGWAQTFEERLGAKLKECLGVPVSIWQDVKGLRVGTNWPVDIEAAIRGAAVFIAVLSPSYKNSRWCKRELDIFREEVEKTDKFEKSSRFFKIVKTPYPDNGHLSFWPMIQQMDFCKPAKGPQPVQGPARFLGLKPGSVAFDDAIAVLVNQSLAPVLRQIRSSRKRIFVASPAKDCEEVWTEFREELSSLGYDVQPEGFLSEGNPDGYIRAQIGNALLSIHLLGTVYDPFAQRQIQLAADPKRNLMFWFAPGTPDAKQARLIENLRAGWHPDHPKVPLPSVWDVFDQLTPRQFIEQVVATLDPRQAAIAQAPLRGEAPRRFIEQVAAVVPDLQEAVTAQPPPPGEAPRLYIVHDAKTKEDAHIASALQEEIEARERMEVFLSPPDQQEHLELLQTCEGVLLCRKAAPETWLDQVVPDVLLADRLFPQAPLKAKAFLVPDPARWSAWPNLKVFPYTPAFQSKDLEPFLAPLRAGGAALGR